MNDDQIKSILRKSKVIAMIGVSSEKKGEDKKNLKRKPANVVMKYMQNFGYKVIPINPFAVGEVVNGEPMVAVSRKVTRKIMMKMLLTGEPINAKYAKDIGLINDCYASKKLNSEVLKIAKKISSKSNLTIKIGKQAFYKQLEMPLGDAYKFTSKMMTLNMASQDAKEGISAFLQKRKPNWKNK